MLRGRLALLRAGRLAEAAGLEAELLASLEAVGGQGADSCMPAVSEFVSRHLGGVAFSESSRHVVEAMRWEVQEFLRQCSRGQGTCPHCQAPIRHIRQDGHVRVFLKGLSKKQATQWLAIIRREEGREGREGRGEGDEQEGHTLLEPSHKQDVTQQVYVSPVEVKVHIQRLWEQDGGVLKAMFEGAGGQGGVMDLFFLTVLPVPPSRFRPVCDALYCVILHSIVCNVCSYLRWESEGLRTHRQ